MDNVLAIIGGSGLYSLSELKDIQTHDIDTPFGAPSSAVVEARVGNARLLFIARHGQGHVLLPSEINYRANIFALKSLGATHVLSVSAVGSLKEEIAPGDLVVVRQYIDKTYGRASTFFGNNFVGHVTFANPVCSELSDVLLETARGLKYKIHDNATLVVMEGPAFSTQAESNVHRQLNADIIGMTALPEAKLAKEAELCYATLGLSTDYDSWREGEEAVSADFAMSTFKANIVKAEKVILAVAKRFGALSRGCVCSNALDNAVMTDKRNIPQIMKAKLSPIFGRIL